MSTDLIISIVVSLLLSAFFSGMEIAFVSSNKLRFELDNQKKTFTSRLLSLFYGHREQFIATMLVGNNIVLVVYSIGMADILAPAFNRFIPNTFIITLLQTIVVTIIVLLVGEFLPKTVFKGNPNSWIKVFSPLLGLFYVLLYPIARLASLLSMGMLKLLRVNIGKKEEQKPNKTDLDFLVNKSIENTAQEEIENDVRIFQNALDFSNVRLRDCIVPRTEIVAVDVNTGTIEDIKQAFIDTGFSKILVYNDSIDNIIGYIHSSDLFKHPANWKECLRQMPIVPETMAANKLLDVFTKEKKSIAVVVDEFGGTAGIVTLEDIMEEIFGEIEDEHDTNKIVMNRLSNNEFMLSGRAEIDSVNRQFDLNLPESDEYLTVAGLILHFYEKFPKLNDVITIEKWHFKVLQATNNRIEMVKLTVD